MYPLLVPPQVLGCQRTAVEFGSVETRENPGFCEGSGFRRNALEALMVPEVGVEPTRF
jgi:hypothetical protein